MKHQTGQIGLVVLLIAAVLLTVGVGVASESVKVQKTTRQETESSETFSAAEDAAEWALGQDLSAAGFDLNSYPGSWSDGAVQLSGSQSNEYSGQILEGQSGQVDLAGMPSGSNIIVRWDGSGCDADTPSIIITTLGQNSLTRYAYGCARGDGFTLPIIGSGYFEATVPASGYTIARIKAVYAPAQVTVSGLGAPQQYTVTATAAKNSGETRAVQVTKDLPAVPWIFDYALFNGSGDIAVTGP